MNIYCAHINSNNFSKGAKAMKAPRWLAFALLVVTIPAFLAIWSKAGALISAPDDQQVLIGMALMALAITLLALPLNWLWQQWKRRN
jgi:hypothetical protein